MPHPITIQLATAQHLPAIDAIYNHYVATSTCTYQTEPTTPAERLAWFNERTHRPEYPVTIALQAVGGQQAAPERVLGWASLNPFHKRAAYRHTAENSVYVHHQHHRQGIGRALLSDLLQRADAIPFHAIIAVISADQTPSIALHHNLGFTECGLFKQVGHKFNRWLDVIYMQRLGTEFKLQLGVQSSEFKL